MNVLKEHREAVKQCMNECSPEFFHINHYWDKYRNQVVAKILPGEFYITRSHTAIATTLGSCIAACLWDDVNKIGGMNHFMLPITNKNVEDINWASRATVNDATRYGNYAMEFLINNILKCGGRKEFLKAKVFGGGKVVRQMSDIGERNINFVLTYLEVENIVVESHDVGGVYPRKVIFEPYSGKAFVKRIDEVDNKIITSRESAYVKRMDSKPIEGDVELF
ncbi:chemoreceptor glutamine deamidase CheD [Thalassotalea sp. PLHSN55]|uniref:chemoreceptor glutamine deamidase CheD n=1 Tax=Thalassotalea sp. PLHSN55 TaxID=3435888 RepID=UPI003F82E2B9